MELTELHEVRSSLLILITIIIAGLTILKFSNTKIFASTYNVRSLISIKPKDELNTGIRLLSTENLFITLILAALVAFCVQVYALFATDDYLRLLPLNINHSMSLIINWLLLVIAMGILYLLKFLFVSAVGWLFDFSDYQSGHYQEYQSIGHPFYFLFSTITAVGVISMVNQSEVFMSFMLVILAIFMAYRILLLTLRLYAKGGYSIFYIFSYICTTEIIPLALAIGFAILIQPNRV